MEKFCHQNPQILLLDHFLFVASFHAMLLPDSFDVLQVLKLRVAEEMHESLYLSFSFLFLHCYLAIDYVIVTIEILIENFQIGRLPAFLNLLFQPQFILAPQAVLVLKYVRHQIVDYAKFNRHAENGLFGKDILKIVLLI